MLKFEVNRGGGGGGGIFFLQKGGAANNFTLCHQLRSQNTSAGIELN